MLTPACIRRMATSRGAVLSAFAAIAALAVAAPTRAGSIIVGTLSTSVGANIPSADLATWITNDLYPGELDPYGAQSLVVLTECFGGNTAQAFNPNPNYLTRDTTVLSATSLNQLAYYGYYDLASAKALKPAAGTTALDVHNAGIAGKNPRETPSISGGLAPKSFSLTPSTNNLPIQGRQVLIYAGSPGGNANTGDAKIRDIIAGNWNNPLDKVTTIGGTNNAGGGAAGWTKEGSAFGLKSAIDAAGNAIRLTNQLNPGPEQQFILDVTDHGGLRNVATDLNRSAPKIGAGIAPTTRTVEVPPAGVQPLQFAPPKNLIPAFFKQLTTNFTTFAQVPTNANAAGGGTYPTSAQLASPRFSVLIPFFDNPRITPQLMLHNFKTSWQLLIYNTKNMNVPPLLLNDSFQEVYNPSGGNQFLPGDDPNHDAGIRIDFQIPALVGTPAFDDYFFNQTLDVYLANYTNQSYKVGEFAQDNPQLSPVSVPEPSSGVLGSWALVIALASAIRRLRKLRQGTCPGGGIEAPIESGTSTPEIVRCPSHESWNSSSRR